MRLLRLPLGFRCERRSNEGAGVMLQYLIDVAAIALLVGGLVLHQDIGEFAAVGVVSLAFILALWGESRKQAASTTEN